MNIESCVSCGGKLVERFASVIDAQTGDTFKILRCESCELGHTLPQPEDLGRHYGEQYYGAGPRHRFTKDWRMGKRWETVQKAFAKQCGGRQMKNLLDIGCGDGTFIELAAKHGVRSLGVEYGDNARKLRALGLDVVESVDDLPKGERFDVVTLWNSLEHVRDPKGMLEATRRLVRDDGLVIIAVPDAGGLQATAFGSDWFHLDVPRHLFHFTRDALVGLMAKTGFTPEGWIHLELEQDVFGWLQSSLNKVFPKPNVLFYSLLGTADDIAPTTKALSIAAGVALGPWTVPAVAAEIATRTGSTMTVIARPTRQT